MAAAAQKGEKAHKESEAKVAELEAKLRESKDAERKAVLELNKLETEAKLLTSVAPCTEPKPTLYSTCRHADSAIFDSCARSPRVAEEHARGNDSARAVG